MPCRYDGPLTESVSDARKKLNEVTALLCQVCRAMDINHDDTYLKHNPELRYWWDAHKEEDRKRLQKEKEEKEAAMQALETIKDRKKKYFGLMLEEKLEPDDREYFNRKFNSMDREAETIFLRFPDLREKYERSMVEEVRSND
jgi:hypothetical protein